MYFYLWLQLKALKCFYYCFLGEWSFHSRQAANTVATKTASPALVLSWCPAVDWLSMSWPESLGVCYQVKSIKN